MEEKKLDSLIRETLHQKSGNLKAPCSLHERVLEELEEKSKEVFFMRKMGWKKLVVVTAALCMLGTIVAVGAGKVAYLVSSSSAEANQFPTFEEAKKASGEMGYPIQLREQFSAGYQYENGNITEVEGMDDTDIKVASYQSLWLNYKGESGDILNLIISKPLSADGGTAVPAREEREINGISVSYYCDRYKIFPPDIEIPQEDLDAEARGELYLSVGSSKIEEMFSCHAEWKKDGVSYSLMNIEKQLSAEEMFSMAKEVMESETY